MTTNTLIQNVLSTNLSDATKLEIIRLATKEPCDLTCDLTEESGRIAKLKESFAEDFPSWRDKWNVTSILRRGGKITVKYPTLAECLAEKAARMSPWHPLNFNTRSKATRGERAYTMREHGFKWNEVAANLRTDQQSALLAAKNYALRNNLAWPIAR